jgi:Winged helix DNA-binding domain
MRALGIGNELRYAATTGTVAIRWEGARAPTVWTVAAPKISPADACRELARRYLHIFAPTTADGFARWAGISRRSAAKAFASLAGSLLPVRSPLGDEWLLAEDEAAMRAEETVAAPARLLPSGDAYFLLDGAERELLVPRADQRERLWTSRVWPGALLAEGGDSRDVETRTAHRADRRVDTPPASDARRDRGRGTCPAASRRARDRGGLVSLSRGCGSTSQR